MKVLRGTFCVYYFFCLLKEKMKALNRIRITIEMRIASGLVSET